MMYVDLCSRAPLIQPWLDFLRRSNLAWSCRLMRLTIALSIISLQVVMTQVMNSVKYTEHTTETGLTSTVAAEIEVSFCLSWIKFEIFLSYLLITMIHFLYFGFLRNLNFFFLTFKPKNNDKIMLVTSENHLQCFYLILTSEILFLLCL